LLLLNLQSLHLHHLNLKHLHLQSLILGILGMGEHMGRESRAKWNRIGVDAVL
jgi:hypothetical protein